MFSPSSPAPISKPACARVAKSSGWDQVDLPQIGKLGSAAGQIMVPDEGVRVVVAFHEHDPMP
ncbi:hypothetical protein XF30_11260 [Bradyrhizobium sp. SUTN9-2]|nr:hypothetical protein XF30_11260 [Bradyrhizobium sp. SUTN9-2]